MTVPPTLNTTTSKFNGKLLLNLRLSLNLNPIPLPKGTLYTTIDEQQYALIDPVAVSLLDTGVLDNTDPILSIRSWPTDADIITTHYNAGIVSYRFWDDEPSEIDVVYQFTAGQGGPPLAIDSDGSLYCADYQAGSGGQTTLRRLIISPPSSQALHLTTVSAPTAHYYATQGGNPNLQASQRRPFLAIGPDQIYAALYTPAYASNQYPQSLKIISYSKDLQTTNWTATVASVSSPNFPTLCCELGSIQTDDAGLVYVTYAYPTRGYSRWFLRVLRTADGVAVTPEIPIPTPGYPQPGTAQSSRLRYVSLEDDYASYVLKRRPNAWWRLNEPSGTSIYDSSGNGHTITLQSNSPAIYAMASGDIKPYDQWGNSINWTWSNPRSVYGIDAPANAAYNPATGSFTWEFLVQTSTTGSGIVLKKADASNANGITIDFGTAAVGKLRARLHSSLLTATSSTALNDGLRHHIAVVLNRTVTPSRLEIWVDGTRDQNVDASSLDAVNLTSSADLFIANDGTASSGYIGKISEVALYPHAAGSRSKASALGLTGPFAHERWLNCAPPSTSYGDLSIPIASNLEEPDAPNPTIRTRHPVPLIPKLPTGGGVVELWQKKSGVLTRLAFATDVVSGLRVTVSLTQLDSLNFAIPADRFSVTSYNGGSGHLTTLQRIWQATTDTVTPGPYDKPSLVRDHIYISFLDESNRKRWFRISSIDTEDRTALTGQALDAAVELSDLLTQYQAGLASFVGMLPSEVATRILEGDQPLAIDNRKFAQDSPAQATILTEVPDLTPSIVASVVSGPEPLSKDITLVDPDAAALISGIPSETVPPDGTTRALPSGYVGDLKWTDPDNPSTGFFSGTPTTDTVTAGPFNLSAAGGANVSACYYGCLKASATGRFAFRCVSGGALRVYFRGQKIYDTFDYSSGRSVVWTSDLAINTWYPFVIHTAYPSSVALSIQFYWTPPGGAEAPIPAANLSHALHGGLTLLRMVDVTSVIRYILCYKRWDGRGLVIGYPLTSIRPAYVPSSSLWPKSMPPGTLLEELSYPNESPLGRVTDWGTGWTRRPGPVYLSTPPRPTSTMQSRTRGYS